MRGYMCFNSNKNMAGTQFLHLFLTRIDTMGVSLGTQCVRCTSCKQTQEVEIMGFINNASAIGHGQACSSCYSGKCGISAYETGSAFDNKIASVCNTIRAHSDYGGKIFVVRHNGKSEYW